MYHLGVFISLGIKYKVLFLVEKSKKIVTKNLAEGTSIL